MLLDEDVAYFRSFKPTVFDGKTSPGFEMIYNNNVRNPQKRSAQEVLSDTAKGIGLESVLVSTGRFESVGEIVEDAYKLDFSVRMRDLKYNDQRVQVKCISKLYGTTFYMSEAMSKSILDSYSHNDFFFIGLGKSFGSRSCGATIFEYSPAFTISSGIMGALAVKSLTYQKFPIDLWAMKRHIDPSEYQFLHPFLCED